MGGLFRPNQLSTLDRLQYGFRIPVPSLRIRPVTALTCPVSLAIHASGPNRSCGPRQSPGPANASASGPGPVFFQVTWVVAVFVSNVSLILSSFSHCVDRPSSAGASCRLFPHWGRVVLSAHVFHGNVDALAFGQEKPHSQAVHQDRIQWGLLTTPAARPRRQS